VKQKRNGFDRKDRPENFIVVMDVGMFEWIIRTFLAVVLSVGSIIGFVVLAWYDIICPVSQCARFIAWRLSLSKLQFFREVFNLDDGPIRMN